MNRKIRNSLIMAASFIATSAMGAPMGYSVNSDSQDVNMDNLYLIDLATGLEQKKGVLYTGTEIRSDTEGLAMDKDGNLYGVDDGTSLLSNGYPTLFPINKLTGAVNYSNEIVLNSLPAGGSNDFGMTFSCNDTLYVTSVYTKTLYEVDLSDGSTTIVGAPGALGVNISAIAAIGNPTRLYGLGNGQLQNGSPDSPNLYSIDVNTGVATLVGPLGLGGDITSYNEGGLAFDSDGTLWAITDRSAIGGQSSQILTINVTNGAATLVSNTNTEVGFESLAIAPPAECVNRSATRFGEPGIPTLDTYGRLLSVLTLLFAGFAFLRKRTY